MGRLPVSQILEERPILALFLVKFNLDGRCCVTGSVNRLHCRYIRSQLKRNTGYSQCMKIRRLRNIITSTFLWYHDLASMFRPQIIRSGIYTAATCIFKQGDARCAKARRVSIVVNNTNKLMSFALAHKKQCSQAHLLRKPPFPFCSHYDH